MENKKASGRPDAGAASALFVRLTPEGQRAVLDTMRRILAERRRRL